jgi:hypothetical protein
MNENAIHPCPGADEIRRNPLFPGFVASMRKILGELAGWPVERVDERMERWIQNRGFRRWFGHDSPASFAAAELVPDGIVGPDRVRLGKRIEKSIEQFARDPFFPHDDPDYDWAAARRRFSDILREFQGKARE